MAEKRTAPEIAGASFGRRLKEARERRGVSLAEISQVTRLTQATLVFLENEEWERLPPPAFVKGFVTAYAEAVEIDPETVLPLYRQALGRIAPLPGGGRRAAATAWIIQTSVVAFFALIVAILVFMICLPGEETERTTAAPAVMAPARNAGPPAQPQEPPLRLSISASEEAWVRVMADGVEKGRFTIPAGRSMNFTARTGFNLLVGTPQAVKVRLDGKDVPLVSRSGQAVNLRLP